MVTVEGSGVTGLPEPSRPDFGSLTVAGQSSSQSVSVVNMSMKSSKTIIYHVEAPQKGTIVIPPVKAVYQGDTYLSSPVTIAVDPSAPQAQPAPARQRRGFFADPLGITPQSRPQRAQQDEEDFFVAMEVDKLKLWQNEQAVATFSFWRAENADLWEKPNYRKPKFEGFWVEEMLYDNGKPDKTFVETKNQRRYEVAQIRYALIPLSTGKLTVDPAVITLSADPWSGLKRLFTKPVEISVAPLPQEGKPPEFTGMVIAKPNIRLHASASQAKVNDSLALTLVIKGEGYLKQAGPPSGPKGDWFESFDPKVSDDLEKKGPALSSTRTVEYPLIVRKEGSWETPPITVAWFDPAASRYETRAFSAGGIIVAKGSGGAIASAPPAPMIQAQETARYIKPDRDRLEDYGSLGLDSWWIWLILAAPAPILPLAWWIKKRRAGLFANLALVRSQNAARTARKGLDDADRADEPDKFFAGLDFALRSYLADKWNIPAPSITRETASARLEKISADLAREFDDLFAVVEMARYSRPGKENTRKLSDKARELINSMEKTAK